MTARPDPLTALAELLPGRVRLNPDMLWGEDVVMVQVFAWDDWRDVHMLGGEPVTTYGQVYVEYALREECRARGWQAHHIPTLDGTRLCVTIYPNGSASTIGTGWADVGAEAEALAAALVAALKGEK